jgi:hypothetical protein
MGPVLVKIYFNIILQFTAISLEWSLSLRRLQNPEPYQMNSCCLANLKIHYIQFCFKQNVPNAAMHYCVPYEISFPNWIPRLYILVDSFSGLEFAEKLKSAWKERCFWIVAVGAGARECYWQCCVNVVQLRVHLMILWKSWFLVIRYKAPYKHTIAIPFHGGTQLLLYIRVVMVHEWSLSFPFCRMVTVCIKCLANKQKWAFRWLHCVKLRRWDAPLLPESRIILSLLLK